jgi:hypothetical protein
VGEAQVRYDLSLVDREEALYGLELDEDAVFDDQIGPVAAIEPQVPVQDRDRPLPREAQAAETKLCAETGFVDGLEEPRTQASMDLDECPDDTVGAIFKPSDLPTFLFHSLPIGAGAS